MKHLAHRGAVTIVGDPDQGIYGWRNAEIGNLKRMEQGTASLQKMQKDSHSFFEVKEHKKLKEWTSPFFFIDDIKDIKNTRMIFLEENYRSSSRILNASLAVVQQGQFLLLPFYLLLP